MTCLFDIRKRWAATAATLGLMVCMTMPAAAQDAAKEIATAQTHAEFAASAADIGGVKTHLHHVVNCLSGPDGQGFDADQANPCGALGNGAIPDMGEGPAMQHLEAALEHAMAGLAASDVEAAQRAASQTVNALKKAQ